MIRLLLPLLAGIIAYDQGLPAPGYTTVMLAILAASALLMGGTAFIRDRSPGIQGAFTGAFALFYAAAGWCAYSATDIRNYSLASGGGYDTGRASVVRVIEEPKDGPASRKMTVEILHRVWADSVVACSGRALLYVYRKPGMLQIGQGDTLLVPSTWVPVRNSGNPFEFDNETFQRRRNILVQQRLSPDRIALIGHPAAGEVSWLRSAHLWCNRQLRSYLRDSATYGLLNAMLLGDERSFDPELRQAYSQTGVVHIVSISGSHVAVLFGLVTALLFWMRGNRGAVIRYVVSLTLVWLYVLIAGAPPSALRSAFMFSIIAFAPLTGREGNSLNTIATAAVILLTAQPAWIFSVGFQLSFSAVLSIFLFYKPIYRTWPQTNRLARWGWQAVSVSIAAEILTAPIVIYYFNNFPLPFIAANLVAGLLVGGCALVGGIAIIALSWLPPVAEAVSWIVTRCVTFFNALIIRLQEVNPVALRYLHITGPELVLMYLLIAGLSIWLMLRQPKGLAVALPAACLLMALLCADQYHVLRQERLVVYSNGRLPLVEHIRGRHFSRIAGPDNENRNAASAHIGWRAWRRSPEEPGTYLEIGGKKVLVLTDSAANSFTQPLPVDVLVVARPLHLMQVGNMLNMFRPRKVVLGVRPGPYHLRRWTDSCAAHAVGLINVSEQGACVVE